MEVAWKKESLNLQTSSLLKSQQQSNQIRQEWETKLSESTLGQKKKEVEYSIKLKNTQKEMDNLQQKYQQEVQDLNAEKKEIEELLN